jgi:hypothetical protein
MTWNIATLESEMDASTSITQTTRKLYCHCHITEFHLSCHWISMEESMNFIDFVNDNRRQHHWISYIQTREFSTLSGHINDIQWYIDWSSFIFGGFIVTQFIVLTCIIQCVSLLIFIAPATEIHWSCFPQCRRGMISLIGKPKI